MSEMKIERPSGGAEGAVQLTVSGPLTIAEAAPFKEALLEALAAREVHVQLEGVTALDLSALQLLCAAHCSAELAGKTLSVAPGENEVYRKVVGEAGFQCHVGCQRDTKSCIWIGGKC